MRDWFYGLYEQLKNFFFFGWNLRKSKNYCATTIYDALYLKLDRIYDVMLNHSHLEWNSSPNNKSMRRLNEAREIAKKLSQDDWYDLSDKESIKFLHKYTNKLRDSNIFGDCFPKAKLVDDKFFTIGFKKAVERDEAYISTLKDRLFYLLKKYDTSWWD